MMIRIVKKSIIFFAIFTVLLTIVIKAVEEISNGYTNNESAIFDALEEDLVFFKNIAESDSFAIIESSENINIYEQHWSVVEGGDIFGFMEVELNGPSELVTTKNFSHIKSEDVRD